MTNLHVIVVSSVRPESTSAGQIILHRHLVDQPGITLEVHGMDPQHRSLTSLVRRLIGRLGRTRLHRFVEDFWVLWAGRWMDPCLPETIPEPDRTVVLTVAHGDGFMAARRFAKRQKLPLVALFQDWWPDMACVHGPVRGLLERRFREIYSVSDAAICVCPGMLGALGPDSGAEVLYPIPARMKSSLGKSVNSTEIFKVFYFGNLGDYGPMLGELLEASLEHTEILIQVRGHNPDWPSELKTKMRTNKRWLDFAPRQELDSWLASADAFLVPMIFDLHDRRRMETSFPSKLIECAKFGKPIIVWGPQYCSAIRWARDGDKAICITNPEPYQVLQEIEKLCKDTARIAYYESSARKAAAAEFNPEILQWKFREILHNAVQSASIRPHLNK